MLLRVSMVCAQGVGVAMLALCTLAIVAGCGDTTDGPSPDTPTSLPSADRAEFERLVKQADAINGTYPTITRWLMDTEHLFMENPELRDRIIKFDREPGNLDLILSKINQRHTKPSEMLAMSQMLLFYAEWQDKSDASVRSEQAPRVVAALNFPQVKDAMQKYPDAEIDVIIKEACEKALQPHQKH